MAWADMADRALKTAIQTFKTSATYIPGTGAAQYAVVGVFNKPYEGVDPETGALVTSTHPTFGVRLADLAAIPASGDKVTIASGFGVGTYRILDSREDGQGGAELTLHREG